MISRRHFGANVLLGAAAFATTPARAEDREVINARVNFALGRMWSKIPVTRKLSSRAQAMLVMPDIVKAGLIVGGAYGEGALLLNDPKKGYEAPPVGYYSVAAASVGLQLGLQSSSHVLFFMTQQAVQKFRAADGWQIGADAEVTFPDAGLNAKVTTQLVNKPVIGYVFGQDGFLAGVSLEGAKYSKVVR